MSPHRVELLFATLRKPPRRLRGDNVTLRVLFDLRPPLCPGQKLPLERTVLDTKTIISRVQIGKEVIIVRSTVGGEKSLAALLFDIICQKESA